MIVSEEEFAEKVIEPLFDGFAKGLYKGYKTVAKSYGLDVPSESECRKIFLAIWCDNELYGWVPENLKELGLNVEPEEKWW